MQRGDVCEIEAYKSDIILRSELMTGKRWSMQ